jgi:hypothetical protein
MAWSRKNLYIAALLPLNLLWSIIVGLFIPRAPAFGLMILIFLIPGLIYLNFWMFRRKVRKNSTTSEQDSDRKKVPMWVYYGSTIAVSTTHIMRKTLPESFLGFLVLTVLLGWPWFEISLETSNTYRYFLNSGKAFTLALFTSSLGLAVGLSVYAVRHTQVMSLFFVLLISSIFLTVVTYLTRESTSAHSGKTV